jgi:hypothetical protein
VLAKLSFRSEAIGKCIRTTSFKLVLVGHLSRLPPVSIRQGHILYAFRIALHLVTYPLASNWQSGLGKVSLSVVVAHKPVGFAVGRLPRETVVAQQVDDIVVATQVLDHVRKKLGRAWQCTDPDSFSMVGYTVICTGD